MLSFLGRSLRGPGRPSILLGLTLLLLQLVLVVAAESYYKILDIHPSSDARTIKKAYRRLAQKLHPDKHPDKEQEFVRMSEAYQVLSDEELRKIYDRYGEEGVKRHRAGQQGGGGGSHDPFDIFRSFFGGGGGGQHQVRKGPSKQFNLLLPLKDLYLGKKITLEYERKVVCHKCDGSGARSKEDLQTCHGCNGRGVRIITQEIMPGFRTQMQTVCSVCGGAGIHIAHKCPVCSGEKLIVEKAELEVEIEPGTQEGEMYVYEGEADEVTEMDVDSGDVFVRINADRSPDGSLFRRRASHLYLTRTLPLSDALLGFEDTITHMDDRNITIRREAVTQNGWVGTVVGEGMPIRSSDKKGNLYVEYQLVLPDKVEGDFLNILERVFKRKALRPGSGSTASSTEPDPDSHRFHEEL